MPLELAIRNRLAVCALMLMLAPYGISLPTFTNHLRAQTSEQRLTADQPPSAEQPHVQLDMPTIYTGGTIMYNPRG